MVQSASEKVLVRQTYDGMPLVDGFAKGEAVVLKPVGQFEIVLSNDVKFETDRFRCAVLTLESELSALLKTKIAEEQKKLLEASLMLLKDRGWNRQIEEFISKGVTAETAIHQSIEKIAERILKIDDTYLQEKLNDFQDLAVRVLQTLEHINLANKKKKKLPKQIILVAQNLGPAELLDYDLSQIKGIVLEKGSKTMHVAIVAKTYGIPLVGGIPEIYNQIHSGDIVMLDGISGQVYQNPSDDMQDVFSLHQEQERQNQVKEAKNKLKPSLTKDGHYIELGINLGLADDILIDGLALFDKVGLYRTELPFMLAKELPDCATQTKTYKKILAHVKGKPVVFRTLDIGSDKVLPYIASQCEENPAMGWRSIRMTLDRRALLRTQIRALIRASEGGALWIMFPMIADISEFLEAKKTLEIELKQAEQRKETVPTQVYVGSMLEIPSLIFQLKNYIHLFDFISIGTNDLMQFLYAADRGNLNVSGRYDCLSVSFLSVLLYIQKICNEARVPCSVCGEMAGRPIEALTLIGLGFNSLSMNPRSLLKVKTALRDLNQEEFSDYLMRLLKTEYGSVRTQILSYLRDHDVSC